MLEKIFIFFTIFLIVISCLFEIPTDISNIGISSENLNIGDREFYINQTTTGYGYGEELGNILYPLILKQISFFTSLFNQDQYSKLWNFIAVFITSSLSIISFHLLGISTLNLFKKNISLIACLIYIFNPYTYYFSLSGGLTNYVLFGVSIILWIFSKSISHGYKISNSENINDIIVISLGCIYLSFLRPNGGIFALIILLILSFVNIKKLFQKTNFNLKVFINSIFLISSILLVIYNLNYSLNYSLYGINAFSNEGGLYFGYSRDLLRERLNFGSLNYFQNIKNFIFFVMWKLTDFVAGISDIRDTHNAQNIEPLFPFLIRTFTGIFILFPVNLFSFFGLIRNFKFILKSDLWILLLASILSISPSLIGVASSRYLIMFYTPFIVFSAKMINDTFYNKEISKQNE